MSRIDLYNEDCLDRLVLMESESVDLIITSPPYNLGNRHHTNNKNTQEYEDDMPEKEYQEWQIKVLDECYRVLKADGSLLYNHKNRIKGGLQITPYEWLLKTKFIIKQEIVWMNGGQNFDKIRFYPMTERIYWMTKSTSTKLFNKINHHDVFGRGDWHPVGSNGIHKRAFPLKMVEDLLDCFEDKKVVLDPFMGSGTVGVGCINKERDFIGIEIDKRHFNNASQRIKEEQIKPKVKKLI